MKVINVKLTQESVNAPSPFDTLMAEILGMRADVLGEAKKTPEELKAAHKAAKEKSKKKASQRSTAEKKRGDLDTEKADKEAGGEKKQVDTSQFKNPESFSSTPEDAHLHTDGKCDDSSLRHNKSAQDYAKHGDLEKNPCDKSYPKFSGKKEKARTAGALRQAYARHDEKAIKELEATARSQGMEPKGASWNERPQCAEYQKTKDPSKLPHGWTAKDCKPHGQGGGDEWLRGHHADSTKAERHKEHPGETRHTSAVNRLKQLKALRAAGHENLIGGPRKRQGHDTHTAQEKHKDVHHEPSARRRNFQGGGKVYAHGHTREMKNARGETFTHIVPRHKKAGHLVMPHDIEAGEKAHMMGNWSKDTTKPGEGGRGGELSRGARRTLSKREQAKRGAPAREPRGEGTKVVRQGAEWHKLSSDKTGKKTGQGHTGRVVPRHNIKRRAGRVRHLRTLAARRAQPVGA